MTGGVTLWWIKGGFCLCLSAFSIFSWNPSWSQTIVCFSPPYSFYRCFFLFVYFLSRKLDFAFHTPLFCPFRIPDFQMNHARLIRTAFGIVSALRWSQRLSAVTAADWTAVRQPAPPTDDLLHPSKRYVTLTRWIQVTALTTVGFKTEPGCEKSCILSRDHMVRRNRGSFGRTGVLLWGLHIKDNIDHWSISFIFRHYLYLSPH